MCLSRDGLMKDPQNTLLACPLNATEVIDYLKTSLSFPDDTNKAEECLHGEDITLLRSVILVTRHNVVSFTVRKVSVIPK